MLYCKQVYTLLIKVYMLSLHPSLQASKLKEQSTAPFTHVTCNIVGQDESVFC